MIYIIDKNKENSMLVDGERDWEADVMWASLLMNRGQVMADGEAMGSRGEQCSEGTMQARNEYWH